MSIDQALPDIVHDAKLETKITSTYIEHLVNYSGTSLQQRLVKKQERWMRDSINPVLGHGGFGIVYFERCGQKVRAVKEIPKQVVRGEDLDYVRELEAVFKFSHPKYSHCFVRSDGWFESPSSVYISMEYLEHGDLQGHLQRPFFENETKHIISQVLEGLEFMHGNNFVHRDLKPGNIMVVTPSPHWFVKIADFGISKRRQEGATSLTTIKRGTLGFCAPEALGVVKGSSWDFEVDMWSLGAVAYRLLTGTTVFDDMMELFRFANGLRSLPTELYNHEVSQDGRSFIHSLLAADPKDRLPTIEASRHPWLDAQPVVSIEGEDDTSTNDQQVDRGMYTPSISEPSAAWTTPDTTTRIPVRSNMMANPKSAFYPTDEAFKDQMARFDHFGVKPQSEARTLEYPDAKTRKFSRDGTIEQRIADLPTLRGLEQDSATRISDTAETLPIESTRELAEPKMALDSPTFALGESNSSNPPDSLHTFDGGTISSASLPSSLLKSSISSLALASASSIEPEQRSGGFRLPSYGTATVLVISAENLLNGYTANKIFILVRRLATGIAYPEQVIGKTKSKLVDAKNTERIAKFEETFTSSCPSGTFFMLEVRHDAYVGDSMLLGEASFWVDSFCFGEEQRVSVKSPIGGFKYADVVIKTTFDVSTSADHSETLDDIQVPTITSAAQKQWTRHLPRWALSSSGLVNQGPPKNNQTHQDLHDLGIMSITIVSAYGYGHLWRRSSDSEKISVQLQIPGRSESGATFTHVFGETKRQRLKRKRYPVMFDETFRLECMRATVLDIAVCFHPWSPGRDAEHLGYSVAENGEGMQQLKIGRGSVNVNVNFARLHGAKLPAPQHIPSLLSNPVTQPEA